MNNLNPFARKTIPYHRMSKESSEDDSDHGQPSSSNASTLAQKEGYGDEDDYLIAKELHRPRRSARLRHACCYILVGVLSLLVGLMIGEVFRVEYEIDGYPAPFGHTHRTIKDVVWQRNDTFAMDPSEESEKAWESLIPLGRGFVIHPKLAKEEKSVSVFHELHCLNGIRNAYFLNTYLLAKSKHLSSIPSSRDSSSSDHPHIPPSDTFIPNPYLEQQAAHPQGHIKHCFDYLRQALMCAADTNLEETEVEDGIRGAPGWGSKRVCRDFERVKGWSERWRSGDGDGIV